MGSWPGPKHMEPPLETMEAEVPDAALLQRQLDTHLAVLRAVPGVTAVTDYPAGGMGAIIPNDPNKNGVRLKLNGKLINVNTIAKCAELLHVLQYQLGRRSTHIRECW